jgi:hypothetical protein
VLSTDNRRAYVSAALNLPRTLVVRALRQQERFHAVRFPHASFDAAELARLVEDAGLRVLQLESFRFHISGLREAILLRPATALDRLLPRHPYGDILALVAEKPA